jgi:hypothetical protein
VRHSINRLPYSTVAPAPLLSRGDVRVRDSRRSKSSKAAVVRKS